MAKAALPATIGIAAFQSTTWATYFGPLNYLVAIEALLAYCIIPRARFMQTLFLNVLMVCTAAAVNLFALWCAIHARAANAPPNGYDASGSTVCAIWFMIQVYLVNALRSSRPQFNFPCINYNIFTMIAVAQAGPTYSTIQQAEAFINLLLQACLTGFALAWGVALLILPHSNRGAALTTIATYFDVLRRVLADYQGMTVYISQESSPDEHNMLKQFTGTYAKLRAIDTKLKGDLEFAVRDIGYGHLTGDDLEQTYKQLRDIYLPILGLQDVAEDYCASEDPSACKCAEREPVFFKYRDFRRRTSGVSKELTRSMTNALDDVQTTLLAEARKGKVKFNTHDAEKASHLTSSTSAQLEVLNAQAADLVHDNPMEIIQMLETTKICDQCRHYIQKMVSIEQRAHFVLWHSSRAIVRLVEFTRDKFDSGFLQRKHIILPSYDTLLKWWFDMFRNPESTSHDHSSDMESHIPLTVVHTRDHRYFSAESYIEAVAKQIRAIPRLLRSPHSIYGFRTLCASMSIGIIAYLRDTHNFFVRQRVIWALIMTMIAMKTTSGQTTWEFILRVLATIAGTVGSFVAWYIVDGHPAGVIVFMWLYMAGSFYFGVVKPRYVILGIVSAVTPLISVGYALNTQKLGPAYLRQINTPDYPIYLVAAYRLLNVIAGLAVAYIWTLLPYPVTETSLIRQNMGACVFLLARYNAIISETLLTRDRLDLTESLASNLKRTRLETLHQAQGYLVKLKALSSHLKWQFTLGTELHQTELNDLIRLLDRMMTHITVFGFASSQLTLDKHEDADEHFARLQDLVTSLHKVTSVLCLVSASITNHTPLPPYLFLADVIEELRPLSANLSHHQTSVESNMNAKAVTVILAAARKVQLDMEEIVRKVTVLCGELDFSAKALSSQLEPQVSYASQGKRKD